MFREFQNLDPYKSAGLDILNPSFLKLSANVIASPITKLFTLSLASAEIPGESKSAAVIPHFKGGDTLDPICYRPISILPCLSKDFDILVNKQITNHLEFHRILSATQSGFRAGHGCTTATLKIINDIAAAIDKKHYCAVIYIDLSNAFDSVKHCIFSDRLNNIGFSYDCLA